MQFHQNYLLSRHQNNENNKKTIEIVKKFFFLKKYRICSK